MNQNHFASPNYDYDGTAHIVFISDLHSGGNRCLAPRNFMRRVGPSDDDREPYHLNLCQQYLAHCYDHMKAHLPRRFILVFVGDLINGTQRGVLTKNCFINPDDQRNAGIELLKPIVRRAERTYMCWGTMFHNPEFSSAEGEAARTLREGTGKPVKFAEVHNIKIFDHTINALHSRASVQDYPSTPMDKEIEGSILAHEMENTPHADFIVRAHIHPNSFAFVSRYDKIAWFNLSWQVPDEYLAIGLARYYRRIPLLGTIVLELRDEPMPSCFRFHRLSYPPPASKMRVEHVKWKR